MIPTRQDHFILVFVSNQEFGGRPTLIAKILSRDDLQFAFHKIQYKETSLSCYLADKFSTELTTILN